MNLGRPLSPEPSTLIVMVDDFPAFEGQVLGRELELELTAVVTNVESPPQVHDADHGIPTRVVIPTEGGSPSRVVLTVVRADIVQTT